MNEDRITSQNNPLVKHIKALHRKKNRKEYRQFVVEGIRTLKDYMHQDVAIDYVLYSNKLQSLHGGIELYESLHKKYKCHEVSDSIITELSDTENPQGIVAVVNMPKYSLVDLPLDKDIFLLVLDRLQDPGNIGTIIRTAVAAGVDGIILTKGCVDPYNSKTIRAAMGALIHVPIIETVENLEWIEVLKNKGVQLIGSSLDTQHTYLDIDYSGKLAIIIGNEANGIEQTLLDQMDTLIKIPILGNIESLNASIAAGILIYKAIEGRRLNL
ncbi:MAG: RNA methyltransferase [Clostridiaceae bacterium]|nr:RNA methyltransferase [Clostridiaceae bacterium]